MKVDSDPLGLELLFEELDKINYADYSSELRRQLIRLQEGPYFIKLLSEVDLLERDKSKLKERFWADKEQARLFSEKLQFIERIKTLEQKIEKYENELSLACLDLSAYNSKIIDKLKEWERSLFQFKIDLLGHEKPEVNQCRFSIYGTGIQKIVKFYLQIFEAKNFEVEAKTVWFKEKSGRRGAQKKR